MLQLLAEKLIELKAVETISDDTVGRVHKCMLKRRLKSMWRIPPKQDAAFVAAMEQVLAVYHRPYDVRFEVVCMDERPIQLVSHSRKPLPSCPRDTTKRDYSRRIITGTPVVSFRLPRCSPAYAEVSPFCKKMLVL